MQAFLSGAALEAACRKTRETIKRFTHTLLLNAKHGIKYLMPQYENFRKESVLYCGAYFGNFIRLFLGDLDRLCSLEKRAFSGFPLCDLQEEFAFCETLTKKHLTALLSDAALFSSDEFAFWKFEKTAPSPALPLLELLAAAEEYFSGLTYFVNAMYAAAERAVKAPRDVLEADERTAQKTLQSQLIALRLKLKRY